MPPRKLSSQERSKLRNKRSTESTREFARMINLFDRPSIIAEGDSWFEYPRRTIVAGPPSNIIDHIQNKTVRKASLLRLGSNGDEATQILSGDQRHKLTELLDKFHKKGKPVDALLFSAGGNDVVGKWDVERFLKSYKPGYSANDCLHGPRFKSKLKQIELVYLELLNIRNLYSPNTYIITHTYDIPYVNGKKAEFLKLKLAGPWLKPYMDDKGIPPHLHRPVCRIMMRSLKDVLIKISQSSIAKDKFLVANTQGTLTSEKQWRDEIHPETKGFGLISKKVYKELRKAIPTLPVW